MTSKRRSATHHRGKSAGRETVISAWNHVATAEPDGYTLLLAENALAMSQALYKKAARASTPHAI